MKLNDAILILSMHFKDRANISYYHDDIEITTNKELSSSDLLEIQSTGYSHEHTHSHSDNRETYTFGIE